MELEYTAKAPSNFEELMINFWMEQDKFGSKEEAVSAYYDNAFIELKRRVVGKPCRYKLDLGYSNKELNGKYCFEIEDNNFVIPVDILDIEL